MKVASFADLHARGKDLQAFRAQWEAALAECVKRKVDLITIAGDIFDRSNIADPHASTGAIVRAVKNPMRGLGIDFLIIPGNHDKAGPASQDALTVFDSMPGVTVVREPKVVRVGSIDFYCLPWGWDKIPDSGIDYFLATPDPFTSNIVLLAHVQVMGAKMAERKTCEGGSFCLARDWPGFANYDRIILGDFHCRQDLFDGRGGYVGALRQLNFGDDGNPAGFEIWDSETGKVEWIELDHAPRFRTITVMDAESIPEPRDNERLRIYCQNFSPSAAITTAPEHATTTFIPKMPETERVQRVKVPAGILDDSAGLLALWAGTQNPLIEGSALAGLQTELEGVAHV